jgi:uncharacterized protein YbjT (DUF2867 family)
MGVMSGPGPPFRSGAPRPVGRDIDESPRPSSRRWPATPGRGPSTSSAGPDVFTFKELMEFVLATIERRRLLVPLPWGLARLQAALLGLMPKPLLTPDQVELLRYDNVVSDAAKIEGRNLEGLGIVPHAVASIVASYLWRFRKAGQFRRPAA